MDEASIFLEALKQPSPGERAAYLDRACGGDGDLRRSVEQLLKAHDQAGGFLADSPAAPAVTVDHPAAEGCGTTIGPYKRIELLGEGGMGTVWMAQQNEPVKRLVAIKLIKAGLDSKQVIARFEAERQALALMDHPNIAKVLDGGSTSSGRPYFVMDLVKGVPITRYCDEHHLTPRQRLELFLPVCQAIQHAHQKGIIHRDIKPSNVLVALYDGKPVPKVIDFGVAKAAGQPLTDKTLVTGFGAIVGTLEYMSPEQAEVNQLDIDTRSDVYSLGVLLYELLAGSPPFSRKELEKAGMLEMLRVIREKEPSKPSTKLSTADGLPTLAANRGTEPAKLTKLVRGELDWIVMKALEKDRTRRYETANGFAMDVQRYLADEAVQACPPSAGYRLRKFARRNKRSLVTAALLGVTLLAAVGAVAGTIGWTAREAANRRADAEARAVEALAEAEPRLRAGNPRDSRLVAAAGRAESQLAGGLLRPELCQRVQELLADLKMLERLDEIRLEEAGIGGTGSGLAGADSKYESAFRDYGVDVNGLAAREAGERLRSRAIAVRLASALDSWGRARQSRTPGSEDWKRLLEVAWTADPDPWRTSFRKALARNASTEEMQRLAAEAMAQELPAESFRVFVAALQDRKATYPVAIDVFRHAQRRHPADFWINIDLAYALAIYERPARAQEAIGYARAAVGIRPDSPLARIVLGICLNADKQPDEAVSVIREGLRLQPNNSGLYLNLGLALSAQKKLDEAIVCYRKAIELDPKATYHNSLGNALRGQKKLEEAIAEYRKAIELDPKATYYNNLGLSLRAQGKLDEAVAAYRKAIELDPEYAGAHNSLGNALRGQKKLVEAIASFRKAIELDPKYALAYSNLGLALCDQKKRDEAVASCRKAIELDPKEAKSHHSLGIVLHDQKKLDEAVACYRKAIELDPKYADAHYNLGVALRDQNKPDGAIACYRKVIELDPKFVLAHLNLGIVLMEKKCLDEAIACYRKAIELDPKEANAHNALGNALKDKGQIDEAITCYRKAIEVDPKEGSPHYNLGLVLYAQKKPDEAIACYRRAIELGLKFAPAHYHLGYALQVQKKLDEAIAEYRKAIEVDPKYVWAHFGLGNVLRRKRQFDEAIASFQKAIEVDPNFAAAHHNLGETLWSNGRRTEAIVAFRKVIELDPKDPDPHYALGRLFLELRREEEAIASFRKAIEIDPSYPPAHLSLAQIFLTRGEVDLALTHYQKAAEKFEPPTNKAMPYANLAGGYQSLGKWDEAVASYKKAIELDPKNISFHSGLGNLLQSQGRWDEALASYRKVIELDPKNGNSHISLGKALESQGKAGEALACYRRAIELAPKVAWAHDTLAWALATYADPKLRDPAAALRHAETAVELAPKAGFCWQTLAWARYRTGDWKGAVAAMTKVTELGSKGDSIEWFLLALAHWKLGDKAESRAWYDKAVEWMEKNQPKNEELRRFRAEASELLGVTVEVARHRG